MKETEMGFVPEENHYKLRFEDPKLAGLSVTVAEISTGELLDLTELAATLQDTADVGDKAAKVAQLFATLAASLVEWNVETRDGDPRPADLQGVRSLGFGLVLKIVMAWISAMADVDIPLPEGSNSGASAPEQSLPMDLLSASPGS